MRVLVIGGGGREMALVEHLVARGHDVWSNGGSEAIERLAPALPLDPKYAEIGWPEVAFSCEREEIDLAIVGPEAPLAAKIADIFEEIEVPTKIFAPLAAAARIETSKAYAKRVMQDAGVPTAEYNMFTSDAEARLYLGNPALSYPRVLKENGLRAGKGVTICASAEEAFAVLDRIEVSPENPLLVEEFLDGFEFSLIVMAHGRSYVALPVAQDHKPIGEGNRGANTGGMGAVSPVPRVTDALYREAIERVIEPTLAQLDAEGNPFTGFLYAGLIATADGVKVIEFNARLGDPEAEVILPRIEGDIAETALALLAGELPSLPVSEDACLGIVLSSPGYPAQVTASPEIPPALFAAVQADPNLGFVHMGTRLADPEKDLWQAHGGRVGIVTARGATIAECRERLLPVLEETLADSPLYYRRDIGTFAQ